MPQAPTPLNMEILPRDIPQPEKYKPRFPNNQKYPFDQMEIGDTLKINRHIETVRAAVRRWVRNHPLDGGTFAIWKLGKTETALRKVADATAPVPTRRPRKTKKVPTGLHALASSFTKTTKTTKRKKR
jgi:hypothetical protein